MRIERTNGRGLGGQMLPNLRPVLHAAGATALLLAAGGCSTIRDHRGYLVDPALTESVLPGVDNRLSVEKSLGQPTLKSQFGQQSWYYISLDTTQRPFKRPRIHAGSIMDVTFDTAGTVQAVSHDGVEHALNIRPDGHKTPTLGRERSFFEDLFGNIGTVGALPGGGHSGPGGQGGGGGGGGGRPGGTGPNGS
jgi:outer membrane protein assembly factor BamE (lipoprotein component of BamABCDE complex)